MMHQARWAVAVFAAACLLLALPATAANQESVLVQQDGAGLTFDAQIPNVGAALSLSGPDGFYFTKAFAQGEALQISVNDEAFGSLADGSYSYQLALTPRIDAATRRQMDQARATGDESAIRDLRAQGKIPSQSAVAYGYFTVLGGAIVSDLVVEDEGQGGSGSDGAGSGGLIGGTSASSSSSGGLENTSGLAQVIATDLVVQGSTCSGFDCVNGESFGFDTIRMKENNLRLHFQDTSVSASFPSVDWRIVANDTSNGGANYLAFEDSNTGRQSFRVEAGAPSNALYVEDGGRIGIGTNTPVVSVHVTDGNTPTLRLEQDGTSGFTPQTFDVASNEANFFIRDATNGSTLVFRIRPGAPTSAIDIQGDGDVGMGTASPSAGVHILRGAAAANGNDHPHLLVEDTVARNVSIMAWLKSNGTGQLVFENTSATPETWRLRAAANSFTIDSDNGGVSGNELTINPTNGNMTILGAMNATAFNMTSDRDAKTNIQVVNPEEVLEKVAALPVSTWSYKTDDEGVQHIGPMAQDFHAAFGLGVNDTNITLGDTAGVALAAIKALNQQLEQKQEEIDLLKARLDALEQKATN